MSIHLAMSRGRPRPGHTTRTPMRRRSRLFAVLAALTLPLSVVAAPFAVAGTDPPFAIDGDVPDDGSQFLDDLEGNVKEPGPLNSNTTKIGVIHNDAVPTLGLTNPNGQVDLRGAWLDSAKDAENDDWIYFAWERDSANGSGFIAYEFMTLEAPAECDYEPITDTVLSTCNPWENRLGDPDPADPHEGDFMILWDQQGGSTELWLRVWQGTSPNLTLSAPSLIPATYGKAIYSDDGFFGEAAVNITDAIYGGVQRCSVFTNVIPSTVTGNSDTADYKDTILTNGITLGGCTSTTVTTPKVVTDTSTNPDTATDVPLGGASIGTGVVAVADSAVVDIAGGNADPSGSVSFWLCKVASPDLCDGEDNVGTPVGSAAVTGASYPVTVQSPTAYVTSAGRYCWRATYSGNSAEGIAGSTDARDSECFTVNPVTPTLATTAGPGTVIGGSISDTATLSGLATQPATPVINLDGTAGPAAGGTVTFTLYGPNDCTTVAYTSSAVSVVGGAASTPNPQFVPTAVGTYYWQASYSGNAPNNNSTSHNGDCSDLDEDVVVTPDSPTIATQATATAVLGETIGDTATISGGYFPASGGPAVGTVTFKLYGPFDSDATITSTSCVDPAEGVPGNLLDSVTVNATRTNDTTASATSAPAYEPGAPGKYAWVASYSGNANNNAVSGTCGDANEASLITKAPASLTTAQSLRPQDSVTVTATEGGTPTGDVHFYLFGPGNPTCSFADDAEAPKYDEEVALSAAGTAVTSNTDFDVTVATASLYKWLVTYEGDTNHLPISGQCGGENFTLTIDNGGTVSSD